MNKNTIIRIAAFLFGIFHVYVNVFSTMSDLWFAAIHFGGFAALCALGFHKGPHLNTIKGTQKSSLLKKITTGLLVLLCLLVPVYLILTENALYARETEFIFSDYVFSIIAILLAIEFTRRDTGWFMPILILLSLSYATVLAPYTYGIFTAPQLSFETILYRSYFRAEGMFGFVASISATYVFMFILFGAFLLRSGAGDFIIKLSQRFAGRYTGGAGLVGVVSSGLMGSVSGSAVANTVSVGVITIPVMKESGFSSRFSAGVIAAASTGGQLMPPVMGAGAFVIAAYTSLSYLYIVAVSILPAILYFLTVGFFVRIEAKRIGLQPDSEQSISALQILKEGWPFIIPFIVLIALLVYGFTPTTSAAWSILAIIIASWFSNSPMNFNNCFEAVLDAVRTIIPTAMLLIAVGIIINVINTTGVGNAFALMITEWAGGSLVISLVLVALASLVLGMGLPVTASYIVLATLCAPLLMNLISQLPLLTLLQAGDLPLGVQTTIDLFGGDPATALKEMPLETKKLIARELIDPAMYGGMLLSAHLIIFWLSQDSNVTPPICLAAFAAAGIAGTKPMATGFTSWKVSKGLYLVPLLFAYSPIITGTWLERIEVFIWSSMGLYAMAGILQWHLERALNIVTAPLLLLSAFLLMWSPLEIYYHFAGAAILSGIIIHQNKLAPNARVIQS